VTAAVFGIMAATLAAAEALIADMFLALGGLALAARLVQVPAPHAEKGREGGSEEGARERGERGREGGRERGEEREREGGREGGRESGGDRRTC
jgi:hypothetical protein